MVSAAVMSVCAILLLMSLDFGPLQSLVTVLNRGESTTEAMSLSARTEIWPLVLPRLADSPRTALVGHGYSTSSLILAEASEAAGMEFTPRHTHNTFLEIMLSVGALGVLLFLLLILYGFGWFRLLLESTRESPGYLLALSSIVVLVMILLNCLTEVYVAASLNLVVMAMVMYTAMLGQARVIQDLDPSTDQLAR